MAFPYKARFLVLCAVAFVSIVLLWIHLESLEARNLIDNMRALNTKNDIQNKYRKVVAEKWIVVATTSYLTPSVEIRHLTNIPGWKVLIIGNEMVQPEWIPTNCIYLSQGDQLAIGLKTIKQLSGKFAGFLFAISHGAKVIYEPGDDGRPVDLLKTFVLEPTTFGLLYTGKTLFNPYHHFGNPKMWPLDFPLSLTRDNMTANYGLHQWRTPSIQRGMINNVDAVFMEKENTTRTVSNVTFDGNGPPVIIPTGIFSPLDFHNTFFRYDAIWALVLKSRLPSKMCDACRGFWIQRLLWEIGRNTGYYPPNAFHNYPSRPHNVNSSSICRQEVAFVKFLSHWRCLPMNSFFECMVQLGNDMVFNKFLDVCDSNLTANVVNDLISAGYNEPARVPLGSLKYGAIVLEETVLPNQKRFQIQMINVTFWPVEQSAYLHHSKEQQNPLLSHISKINHTCQNTSIKFPNISMTKSIRTYPHILLIIVFNFAHYGNIPFLETMYRMHFPHIVYCGAHKDIYEKHTRLLKPVTFLEVDIGGGWFAHNCLLQAMKMNYKVDGYIYLGDDTLLNVWNLHSVPWDKLWFVETYLLQQSKKPVPHWMWFGMPDVGLNMYQKAINASKSLDKARFARFFELLARNTGKPDGFFRTGSDIAYVPKRLRGDVLYFLGHFSKFNLFVEMAFPTVFGGIDKWENVYELPGMYLWYDGKREHIEKYFNKTKIFLHPVKIAPELQKSKGRKFYCETYLPLTLQ